MCVCVCVCVCVSRHDPARRRAACLASGRPCLSCQQWCFMGAFPPRSDMCCHLSVVDTSICPLTATAVSRHTHAPFFFFFFTLLQMHTHTQENTYYQISPTHTCVVSLPRKQSALTGLEIFQLLIALHTNNLMIWLWSRRHFSLDFTFKLVLSCVVFAAVQYVWLSLMGVFQSLAI